MGRFDDYEDDGEIDEEENGAGDRSAGTILRPLHAEQAYHPDWERDPKKKLRPTWDPTIRWGDETFIELPTGFEVQSVANDLLNVTFTQSRGQTCRVWLHGEIVEQDPVNGYLIASGVELIVGCGSQTTTIRKTFNGLPQIGAQLDLTWELPIQNIRGRVAAFGRGTRIRYSLWLVPIVGATDEVL